VKAALLFGKRSKNFYSIKKGGVSLRLTPPFPESVRLSLKRA
jgi:hypothetical protein